MNSKKITFDEAGQDIAIGKFDPKKRYLDALKSEQNTEFLPYAYQFLGDCYMHINELAMVAKCLALSLEYDNTNYELTRYLRFINAADYSERSIYRALIRLRNTS